MKQQSSIQAPAQAAAAERAGREIIILLVFLPRTFTCSYINTETNYNIRQSS